MLNHYFFMYYFVKLNIIINKKNKFNIKLYLIKLVGNNIFLNFLVKLAQMY